MRNNFPASTPAGVHAGLRSGIKMGAENAFHSLDLESPSMTETDVSGWHLNYSRSMETR